MLYFIFFICYKKIVSLKLKSKQLCAHPLILLVFNFIFAIEFFIVIKPPKLSLFYVVKYITISKICLFSHHVIFVNQIGMKLEKSEKKVIWNFSHLSLGKLDHL